MIIESSWEVPKYAKEVYFSSSDVFLEFLCSEYFTKLAEIFRDKATAQVHKEAYVKFNSIIASIEKDKDQLYERHGFLMRFCANVLDKEIICGCGDSMSIDESIRIIPCGGFIAYKF